MSRPVLAVALGALIGLLVALFLGWLGDYVFPPSVLADMNPALAKNLPMPAGEIVVQLLGWAGSTVLGGFIALRSAEDDVPWPAWAVAGILGAAMLITSFLHPHPIWFVALCLIAIGAAGYATGRFAGLGVRI